MLSATKYIKSSLKSLPHSFISLLTVPLNANSSTKTQQDKNLKPGDPKWMRFFRPAEPMKIDLERAIKCENLDLLGNYVKSNFQSFDFSQLAIVLEPLRTTTIIGQLMQEVTLRILSGKAESSPALTMQLLRGGREIMLKDHLLKKYMLLELDTHFDSFSHDEKIEALNFMFTCNEIQAKKLYSLFDHFRAFNTAEKIKEYFDKLPRDQCFLILTLMKHLYDSLQSDSFYTHIDRKIVDGLIKRVLFLNSSNV